MFLAIDVGNSECSFGLFEGKKLAAHWRLRTSLHTTSDEYGAFLFPLLHSLGLSTKAIGGVALCSVVPPADFALRRFSQDHLGKAPIEVKLNMDLGFQLNVDVPAEVGADRIANTAYAIAHLPLPVIIVDMGTATTFDIVTQPGAFQGGLILPGLRMCADMLGSQTAKLPTVDLKFPKSVLAKNTVDCIRAGVLFGYCDMINGLLERHFKEIPENWTVVLTGGFAIQLKDHLSRDYRYEPHLTLEGIRLLYERNMAS